jgi:hypothetical protein
MRVTIGAVTGLRSPGAWAIRTRESEDSARKTLAARAQSRYGYVKFNSRRFRMTQSPPPSVRFSPAITGVILALGLFAPAIARGDCGNYVTYANPAHAPPMGDHGPLPGQCHGPNCSQVPPPAPMPEAPPSVRILTDDSLPVSGRDSAADPGSHPLGIDSAAGTPVRRAADVYHPPR